MARVVGRLAMWTLKSPRMMSAGLGIERKEPVAEVSSEYRRATISSVDNRDQDGEVVARPNSMDLRGGNNDLKVASPNVEGTNLTSQTTECGVLRDEVGTIQEGCKGNGVLRGKSDFH